MNTDALAARLMEIQKAQGRVRSAVKSLNDYMDDFGCVPQDRIDELQQASNALADIVNSRLNGMGD